MDIVALICSSCKTGVRIPLESVDQSSRDAFFEAHLNHTGISMITDEDFQMIRLPAGYTEIGGSSVSKFPVNPALLSKSKPQLALDGKAPPFGFPGSPVITPIVSPKADLDKPARPSWDDYFLRIAEAVALRGTCTRLQVGAVLTQRNKIIATGYNGAPSGLPHCNHAENGDLKGGHCSVAEHAERNAIIACEIGKNGSTLYCTASPCVGCLRSAVTAGVSRFVYRSAYRESPEIQQIASLAKIELVAAGR